MITLKLTKLSVHSGNLEIIRRDGSSIKIEAPDLMSDLIFRIAIEAEVPWEGMIRQLGNGQMPISVPKSPLVHHINSIAKILQADQPHPEMLDNIRTAERAIISLGIQLPPLALVEIDRIKSQAIKISNQWNSLDKLGFISIAIN